MTKIWSIPANVHSMSFQLVETLANSVVRVKDDVDKSIKKIFSLTQSKFSRQNQCFFKRRRKLETSRGRIFAAHDAAETDSVSQVEQQKKDDEMEPLRKWEKKREKTATAEAAILDHPKRKR